MTCRKMPLFLWAFLVVCIVFEVTFVYQQKQKDEEATRRVYLAAQQAEESIKARQRADVVRNGPLVLAARDIRKGTKITSDAIETQYYPRSKIPAMAVTNAELVIGKTAACDIKESETIQRDALELSE